jgi:deoxyribonuclease-4
MEQGILLQESHKIGNHVGKAKTITATLNSLHPTEKPYQMFLSGPLNTKISIKDEELEAAKDAQNKVGIRMYVHSPYIINLCQEPGTKEDYGVVCLMKNLQYASRIGLRGVVVHVGKSTKTPLPLALEYMRTNLTTALAAATESCPILLETPAGQGTETLTTHADFVAFVQSFNTPKLRICVDTCHVFASGQNPLDYIQKTYTADPTLIKLVHFNDSETPCGSCVDRHAFIGTGKIGYAALKEIADYCRDRTISMVVE